ncbi:type I restriction endonuclease subunit R [Alienimonas chondri]|uniref:Type I restriction enzyme endonuclease subunit n=1 Tax=Alienimonas chondri TaxID=2681879 RepID=A0ABX1V986_9PLAN|nr:type I restriction endonuclease subunit R [Alienimonas chondri]NNJ24643.1 hypothetical protein [Alienimonas chondri]
MTAPFNEETVELLALEWLGELGYAATDGATLDDRRERGGPGEVVLEDRLRAAVDRINPEVPADLREEAVRRALRTDDPTLVGRNREAHRLLVDGVPVERRRDDGTEAGEYVRLLDFDTPGNNDLLAVRQLTIVERSTRRPDVVVFVNGLPLAVIEVKNPADEKATLETAFDHLDTYRQEIPSLFRWNALQVITDGTGARGGSLTAPWEWFKVWRVLEDGAPPDETNPPPSRGEMDVLIRGVFEPTRLLALVRDYTAFEEDPDTGEVHKLLAQYHQYHAVEAAVDAVVAASRADGDRRGGVVWHTQGSGKSLSMLFFAGRIARHPAMGNPTLVMLTDRNDLDDQLFGQFQRCEDLLGNQSPAQAEDVEDLRDKLRVASGGVVFTTLQKFAKDRDPETGKRSHEPMPLLSERRNVVVVADEAHRSQYDLIDGLARNLRDALPGASFLGFTGTPIETTDADTRAVFGEYVSIYDVRQAVEDGATKPIFYESRVVKLGLDEAASDTLDADFDLLTVDEEDERKGKLLNKWAALEAVVGDSDRIDVIAADLITHFEKRLEAMDGKAMVVGMSRRICVELHDALVKLRPEWMGAAGDDPEEERKRESIVKVIMTGSASDGPDWQKHIRTKRARKTLAGRFKDPADPFRIVIVRDMWLTGFDAPCLHTMYVDKPMKGHALMQAIARVNRVFRDKPGGLVVDYLGLADQLRDALKTYTRAGGQGAPSRDAAEAEELLQEAVEIVRGILHGFNYSTWPCGSASERFQLTAAAQDYVFGLEDGAVRYRDAVGKLKKAFALSATSGTADEIRDEVAFFDLLATAVAKTTGAAGQSGANLDHAVKQLVSEAVVPDGEVVDVFSAAGLDRPDLSILSDEFLGTVERMPERNLAVELLRTLLEREAKTTAKRNVVQSESLLDKLRQTMNAYHNRAIDTHEVLQELLGQAREFRERRARGESLGLSDDELAFYDALTENDSAREAMQNDDLKTIAEELTRRIRKSVTVDWHRRESARAKIRIEVKRILKAWGYPPDLRASATELVLEQAARLCDDWAA